MWKLSLILITSLFVVACTQSPAQVVSAKPTLQRKPWSSDKESLLANSAKIQSGAKLHMPPPVASTTTAWVWPAKGRATLSMKGLDIISSEGAPILAANDGEVVYSGNSLRGYGNLIIIKHAKNFISAYAHNRKNMVKEGERVSSGQKIAEMGRSGTDKVKLHFEVRYKGDPIDPRDVLPNR